MIASYLKLMSCAVLTVVLSGCSAAPEPATSAENPSASEAAAPEGEPVKKPFMFNEASLPDGFPKVGPVGEVIVKQYPAHRVARVMSEGVGGQNAMFRPLFNHIKRREIAMTAPVEMVYEPASASTDASTETQMQVASMAFMYQSVSLGEQGADPDDPRVVVEDQPAGAFLSVTVRGGYGKRSFERGLTQLNDWLAVHPDQWRVVGPPRYLGYNSPFVPGFLRIGEVQLPVEPR